MSRYKPILKEVSDDDGKYLVIEVFDQRDQKSKFIFVNKLGSPSALTDVIADKVSKGGDVILGDLTISDGLITIERSGLGLLMKGATGEEAPLQIFNNPDASVNQRFTKVGVRDALLYSVESDSGAEQGTGNNVKLITIDTTGLVVLPNGGISIQGKFIKKINNFTSTGNVGNNVANGLVDTTSGPVTLTIQSVNIAEEGREIFFKDVGGVAGANNITIATEGSETIDGAATYTINSNYGKVTLVSDGTNLFVKHE